MKRFTKTTALIVGLIITVPTLMMAQTDTTKFPLKTTNIISVEENFDHTKIIFPGGKVEVMEHGDTLTKVTIGSRRFEVIEKPNNKTRIQMVHIPRQRFKGHWAGLDLGFTNFFTSPLNSKLPPEDAWMDLNSGKSMSIGFNLFQYNFGLQSEKNNIGFVTGIGWHINNYRMDSRNILRRLPNGQTGYSLSTRNVKKNKLVTSFLTIPLLLEVQAPKNSSHADFFISAGPYGSFRLGSHTKVLYDDQGDREKEKWREDLNLNAFKYGFMIRTGYKWLRLYATCDLSRMIEAGRGPKLYPWTIGLTLLQF